jgi:hypothetical protein
MQKLAFAAFHLLLPGTRGLQEVRSVDGEDFGTLAGDMYYDYYVAFARSDRDG